MSDWLSLGGRTALVTGSGRGHGLEIAGSLGRDSASYITGQTIAVDGATSTTF
jgi:NAD(P)-dependent dehydrogenase (short-subunit alcohol dehydrogenase family)